MELVINFVTFASLNSIVDIYRRIQGPQFFEINADESLAEVEGRIFEHLELTFPTLRR